jgi:hypothetical protein
VRVIQCTQFRAKNAKNDLNPTNLVKHNFCFETEGVLLNNFMVHHVNFHPMSNFHFVVRVGHIEFVVLES